MCFPSPAFSLLVNVEGKPKATNMKKHYVLGKIFPFSNLGTIWKKSHYGWGMPWHLQQIFLPLISIHSPCPIRSYKNQMLIKHPVNPTDSMIYIKRRVIKSSKCSYFSVFVYSSTFVLSTFFTSFSIVSNSIAWIWMICPHIYWGNLWLPLTTCYIVLLPQPFSRCVLLYKSKGEHI